MSPLLDAGVTPARVSEVLERSPIVSIVGFQRSGKSTLAETLHRHLGRNAVMQTASAWTPRAASGTHHGDASIDPEILHTITELERLPAESCWIVDDAEVMFAYATERVLIGLGEQLQRRRFSVVLIRNRFVREGEGWFHQRQSLLAPNVPTLTMQPMSASAAVAVATAMLEEGPFREQQGRWLAAMSGGVPGLMADLYRYTPPWLPYEPDEFLLRFAARKHEELELGKRLRALLVRALRQRVLPPLPLLSDDARRELGVLLVAGMVRSAYATEPDPFHGEFWHVVSGIGQAGYAPIPPIPKELHDIGMTLELMFGDTDLLEDVKEGCGVEGAADGVLAAVLAMSLYCERNHDALVRPLPRVLSEILGRYGLVQALKTRGLTPPMDATSSELVETLLEIARS